MTPDDPHRTVPISLSGGDNLRNGLLGIIAFAVILFLLFQARFILISLVIAVILFTLTTDAINSFARMRIGSWRVANWLASVAAFTLIATVLLALSAIIIAQINTVVSTTLAYTDQAIAAIARLAAPFGPDTEAAVMAAIRSVDVSSYIRTAAGQAGNLLSATTLVILFVGFLFGERIWFNTKLENLMQDRAKAARIERIIANIKRRVNHYLLVKTGVSLVTAAAVYGVMALYSLQFAMAMAILTFVLNYLPSVGSIIATIMVALVAYMQVDDPATALLIFVIVGMLQFVLGSVIDPMLMGRALRVSSFGIIISLAFWGMVWGVPGMFLAVPIMVATMIICSHIPGARPVAILLSREGLPDMDIADPATTTNGPETGTARPQAAE